MGRSTFTSPTARSRVFQPNSQGGYDAQPGDYGTLAALPDGGYTLTELDGQVTAYNPDGTLNYVQDTNGDRITAGYTDGLLTSLTDSSGQFLTLAYNAAGLVSSVTDSDGRTTTYSYDPTNQYLLSATTFDGETTSYTYDTGSNPTTAHALLSVTNPDGSQDFFSYNAQGYLADAHLNGGAEDTTFTYNEGQVAVTDALGDQTVYSFDNRGLLVSVQNPLGQGVQFSYDSNFNLVQVIDAGGQVYKYTYGNEGNLLSSTDPLGDTVSYTYSPTDDRLASVTDPDGNTTQYAYDGKGNLTSTIYANGTVASVAYDPIGNVISTTDQNGQTATYMYDSAGNVLTATYADGTVDTYTYDAHENLTSATDSTGTTTLTYDANDRLIQITYPSGRFLHFTYDAAGQRTQMVDQDGFTVNYSYDDLGNLATLTDGSGNLIVLYTYDAAGRLIREDNGNGTYTTYTYNAASELLDLINYAPDGTVNSRFDYTYDASGNCLTEATMDGTWTYTYDAIGQLIGAIFAPNSTDPDGLTAQNLQYVYDAAGNRTQTIINGVTTTYTTNNMNEYTQVGGTTYSYDADGNMTSATDVTGTTTYAYNVQNQLTGVTGPSGSWTYQYDVFGNLAATTANGQTTQYLIDPTGLGNGVATYSNSGALLDQYTYGLGLTSQVDASGASSYFDFDATGSTADVTGANGLPSSSYSYLPFGQTLSAVGTSAKTSQFVGQWGVISVGDGLDLMGARSYDPSTGQFVSVDPLGISQPTLYSYADNDPVENIDPIGLNYVDIGVTLSAGFGAFTFGVQISKFGIWGYGGGGSSTPGAGGSITFAKGQPAEGGSLQIQAAAGPGFVGVGGCLSKPIDKNLLKTPPWKNLTPQFGGGFGLGGSRVTGVGVFQVHTVNLFRFGNPPIPSTNNLYSRNSKAVSSEDPNALYGPAGYGPDGFVAPDTLFPYQITFENDPTATAPAQRVDITDQLDPNLDWSTFQFTGFGFGDNNIEIPAGYQHYQTTVPMTYNGQTFDVIVQLDFDPGTGTFNASFQSIDPNTDLPPDVLTGFLPPEDGTGRGDGYVSFLIQAKAGLPTGTQIRNVAQIQFDLGEIIATDQVNDDDPSQGVDPTKQALNTIDAGPPTSSVNPLPATESSPSFTVSWSGQDDPGGSGIASYDVYYSDNGGAFQAWQTQTTATSATFTGQAGHTYAFYSVATDNVGNIEATPTAPQATTLVLIPTTTSLIDNGPNPSNVGDAVNFVVTVAPTVPDGETVTLEDASNGNAVVGTGTLTGGTMTISVSTLTAGTHNIFAIYGGDATYALSQSDQVAQVVNPGPAPALTSTTVNEADVTIGGQSVSLAGKQRSMVDNIVFHFNEAVTLDPGAFTIALHAGVSVNGGAAGTVGTLPTLSWTSPDGGLTWVVTFSGAGVVGGSIADGDYDITVVSTAVHANGQTMTSDVTNTFYRLFGDTNGAGQVSGRPDLVAMQSALGTSLGQAGYLAYLDYNGDGIIAGRPDFQNLQERLGIIYTGLSATI